MIIYQCNRCTAQTTVAQLATWATLSLEQPMGRETCTFHYCPECSRVILEFLMPVANRIRRAPLDEVN